jgi:hypothetical protein
MRTPAIAAVLAGLVLAPVPAAAQEPVVEVLPPPPEEAAPPEAVVVTTAEPPGTWSFGIAASVGVTVPTSELGPMVVGGLELDLALPVLDRRLVLALAATLTRPSVSGSGTDPRVGGAYDYDLAVTELKLSLDVIYRLFPADRSFVPYLGVGPVLHLLKTTESTTLAPGDNTEQGTAVGVEGLLGADLRLGPGMLLGELRYVYSKLDHLWTGDSNVGNVTISIGYRLVF